MAVHFSLFRGTSDTASEVALTPVTDSVIPVLGSQQQLSKPLQIVGAGAGLSAVTAASAAFLDIPSQNDLGKPAVAPVFQTGQAPLTLDVSLYPIRLQVGDPVGVFAAKESAVTYLVGIFYADELECPGPEPIALVPYTCEAPASASVPTRWQPVAMTIATRLQAGTYRILGARHFQTYVEAMRLVLAGQTLRPGAFTLIAGNTEDPALPRPDTTGVLGTFDAVAPPSLELYQPGAGAPATGSGFLLLQRVSAASGKGGCGCGKGGGGCGCGGACGGGR